MTHHIHLARAIAETEILSERLQVVRADIVSNDTQQNALQDAMAALREEHVAIEERGHQLVGEQAVAAKVELPEGMTVADAYANNHEGLADEVAAIKAEMQQP